ncbi:hypothetical protein RM704_30775 [Streptomyces sp. DSM 3412]|uniref:Uncharacterized protein n=1 Tax=Streptomyces gottesmaniae TaxID=3075518 RepID=A0ABU2Z6G2_9ACTN|nr:hypothetical protein [Streptomyces sp. DSM 3412]MDT0571791.1 hypothetical protein [Streptomyces sp. DSM 3412]
MNVFLWVVQAALAAMAGVMKSTQPKDKLAEKLPWAAGTVRFIGVVEFAAASSPTRWDWTSSGSASTTRGRCRCPRRPR